MEATQTSINQQMDKMLPSHMIVYYSSSKNNEVLIHAIVHDFTDTKCVEQIHLKREKMNECLGLRG